MGVAKKVNTNNVVVLLNRGEKRESFCFNSQGYNAAYFRQKRGINIRERGIYLPRVKLKISHESYRNFVWI